MGRADRARRRAPETLTRGVPIFITRFERKLSDYKDSEGKYVFNLLVFFSI